MIRKKKYKKMKKYKRVYLNKERNVFLSPYIVTKKETPCILLMPGGAYGNCEESESRPAAEFFNNLGYNCFVLCYSVGKHYKWPYPLEDYEQAVTFLKNNKEYYHIDTEHLAVIGFSAGGHLSSAAATLSKQKPFAAAICYGVTDYDTLKFCAPDAPETWKAVDADTCPCFLAYSRNDWIVPSHNAHKFMDALEENFIDYEAHIYGYSMHGFGVGQEAGTPRFCACCGDWANEFVHWFSDLISGTYTRIRENCDYVDTHSEVMSSGNSCAVIYSNKEAERIIRKHFTIWYIAYRFVKKSKPDYIATASMRNIMQLLKCNPDTIKKMDEELSVFSVKIL